MQSSVVFKTIVVAHPYRKLIIYTLLPFEVLCLKTAASSFAVQSAIGMESVFFKVIIFAC